MTLMLVTSLPFLLLPPKKIPLSAHTASSGRWHPEPQWPVKLKPRHFSWGHHRQHVSPSRSSIPDGQVSNQHPKPWQTDGKPFNRHWWLWAPTVCGTCRLANCKQTLAALTWYRSACDTNDHRHQRSMCGFKSFQWWYRLKWHQLSLASSCLN